MRLLLSVAVTPAVPAGALAQGAACDEEAARVSYEAGIGRASRPCPGPRPIFGSGRTCSRPVDVAPPATAAASPAPGGLVITFQELGRPRPAAARGAWEDHEMKRTLWLVCIGAALGACSPETGQRLLCDDAGGCESGYACVSGRCVPPDGGGPLDAGEDGDVEPPPPTPGAHLAGRFVWTGGSLGGLGWGAGVIMTTAPARDAAGDQLRGGLTGE